MFRWCTACLISVATIALAAEDSKPVVVNGVTVVGFFPPFTQQELDQDDGGIREGTAHVGFALDDLAKCLADRNPAVHFELTRSLTLQVGAETFSYQFQTDSEHSVGIVLAQPGREPTIVYATVGPSSLQWLALDAAADYFEAPQCKSEV
jgi:hypothetical protein